MATDATVVEVFVESPIALVEVIEPGEITVIEVVDRGIQGPPGRQVPQGPQIYVQETAPEFPLPNDIWIDIS